MWADNHVMVLLKGGTSDARSRHAALAFLKFLYDEGGVWSRTGQLPTRRSLVESPSFTRLPLRSEIAAISRDGVALAGEDGSRIRLDGFAGRFGSYESRS